MDNIKTWVSTVLISYNINRIYIRTAFFIRSVVTVRMTITIVHFIYTIAIGTHELIVFTFAFTTCSKALEFPVNTGTKT